MFAVPPSGTAFCCKSRSGGIGRRAWFRSMYPQGCGGSSPFFGTTPLESVAYEATRFMLYNPAHESERNRKTTEAERDRLDSAITALRGLSGNTSRAPHKHRTLSAAGPSANCRRSAGKVGEDQEGTLRMRQLCVAQEQLVGVLVEELEIPIEETYSRESREQGPAQTDWM